MNRLYALNPDSVVRSISRVTQKYRSRELHQRMLIHRLYLGVLRQWLLLVYFFDNYFRVEITIEHADVFDRLNTADIIAE